MNKLVTTLATTTVLFAASSAYLGYRLHERGLDPGGGATASAARVPVAERPANEQTTPVESAATTPPAPATAAVREAIIDLEGNGRQMMADHARKTLPDLDDPQKRQKMLDESKSNLRRTYRDLGKFLGISAAAEDQLFELLATQEQRQLEAALRCALEAGCRLHDVGRGSRTMQLQEIAALIGADKEQRFEEYQMSMSERMSMAALRGRFDDATRLTDDQAEHLIVALAEVRQRAEGELASRNAGLNEFGGGVFGFVYSGETGANTDADAQLAEAVEYGKRVRERAAQILSPAQMAVFDDARAETLRNLEITLRQSRFGSR